MLPVGYKSPPIEHRFPPGVSGNPAGGKRGPRVEKRRPHPFDQITEVTVGTKQVKMTMARRLIMTARNRAVTTMDEKLEVVFQRVKDRIDRAALRAKTRQDKEYHRNLLWSAGSKLVNSNDAVQHLGIGRLLWPDSVKARMNLEPFIVQQAIDRMERGQLTKEEQKKVLRVTRCAWKLKLPDWWHVDAKPRKKRSSDAKQRDERESTG
jgi:hypothetical protein